MSSSGMPPIVDNGALHVVPFMVHNDSTKLSQEGSEEDDRMSAAAALGDGGVVFAGFSSGTWNGVASVGGADFAAAKLDSAGSVIWRMKVKLGKQIHEDPTSNNITTN